MNFDFSDEQKEIKDQARRFLEDKCDPTVVRRILEGDEPYAADLWKGLAEMGWLGTALPEEYGGIGYGYLELCVIAEEMGRAVAPVPFSSSIYLAAEAILACGSEEQKKAYLPKMAAGEIVGTLALAEGPRPPTLRNLQATFKAGKISGVKTPVPDGDIADFAVVVAKQEDGCVLALVDLKGEGATRETIDTVDPTRSHGTITFDGAAAEPLASGPRQGWEALQYVLDRAAVLVAFEQIGGAGKCLEMACAHSVERYAFGRPIGSFQAIKNRLADMYVKNELARSNAYYGAWALHTDAPQLPLAAATARVAAIQAYHFASKESIQIHGGMGFTWESDCHFYYRRAKLLSLTLGSARFWKNRLVAQLEEQTQAKQKQKLQTQPVS